MCRYMREKERKSIKNMLHALKIHSDHVSIIKKQFSNHYHSNQLMIRKINAILNMMFFLSYQQYIHNNKHK